MGLFDRITSFFNEWGPPAGASSTDDPAITNPATGLPMMGTVIDVAGNPFGATLSDHHRHDDGHHDTHRFDLHDSTSWSSGMGGGHDPWRD